MAISHAVGLAAKKSYTISNLQLTTHNLQLYVLIMAGGVGSRFWPASRENLPKQFLDITGDCKSLIRMTFERFAAFVPIENIFVITNEAYLERTNKELLELPAGNIFTEPSRNNTAAAIALASLKLAKKDKDRVCIVAPADHIIRDQKEFEKVIGLAAEHAQTNNSIVTLGMTPTRPDTGYGYIEFEKNDKSDIRKVFSFREKPGAEKAKEYIEEGNFTWNSGIFIWKLDTIIRAFENYAPHIYEILKKGNVVYNTPAEPAFLQDHYSQTESISVDYAILEKASNVYTIPCDIGWSDVGTWNSLFDITGKDANNNAVLSAPVHLEATHQSIILSKNGKLVVIKGLEDFIVVDTEDCLLIYPKAEEQDIKGLREELKNRGYEKYI